MKSKPQTPRVFTLAVKLLLWSSVVVNAQREDEAVSNALTAVDIIRIGDPDDDMITGTAGSDYPTYADVPNTAFDCRQQGFPGYYADQEAQCQVFHICVAQGRRLEQFSFLCPNGTIFNQQYLVCVWWYDFDCSQASTLYNVNAGIFGETGAGPSSLSDSSLRGTPGTAAASASRGRPAAQSGLGAQRGQDFGPEAGREETAGAPSPFGRPDSSGSFPFSSTRPDGTGRLPTGQDDLGAVSGLGSAPGRPSFPSGVGLSGREDEQERFPSTVGQATLGGFPSTGEVSTGQVLSGTSGSAPSSVEGIIGSPQVSAGRPGIPSFTTQDETAFPGSVGRPGVGLPLQVGTSRSDGSTFGSGRPDGAGGFPSLGSVPSGTGDRPGTGGLSTFAGQPGASDTFSSEPGIPSRFPTATGFPTAQGETGAQEFISAPGAGAPGLFTSSGFPATAGRPGTPGLSTAPGRPGTTGFTTVGGQGLSGGLDTDARPGITGESSRPGERPGALGGFGTSQSGPGVTGGLGTFTGMPGTGGSDTLTGQSGPTGGLGIISGLRDTDASVGQPGVTDTYPGRPTGLGSITSTGGLPTLLGQSALGTITDNSIPSQATGFGGTTGQTFVPGVTSITDSSSGSLSDFVSSRFPTGGDQDTDSDLFIGGLTGPLQREDEDNIYNAGQQPGISGLSQSQVDQMGLGQGLNGVPQLQEGLGAIQTQVGLGQDVGGFEQLLIDDSQLQSDQDQTFSGQIQPQSGLGQTGFLEGQLGAISEQSGFTQGQDFIQQTQEPAQREDGEGYSYPAPATSLVPGAGITNNFGTQDITQGESILLIDDDDSDIPTQTGGIITSVDVRGSQLNTIQEPTVQGNNVQSITDNQRLQVSTIQDQQISINGNDISSQPQGGEAYSYPSPQQANNNIQNQIFTSSSQGQENDILQITGNQATGAITHATSGISNINEQGQLSSNQGLPSFSGSFSAENNFVNNNFETTDPTRNNIQVDIAQQLQYLPPTNEFSSVSSSSQSGSFDIIQQPQNAISTSNIFQSAKPVSLTDSLKQEILAPVTQEESTHNFPGSQSGISGVDLTALQQGYLPPVNDNTQSTASNFISSTGLSSPGSISSPSLNLPSSSVDSQSPLQGSVAPILDTSSYPSPNQGSSIPLGSVAPTLDTSSYPSPNQGSSIPVSGFPSSGFIPLRPSGGSAFTGTPSGTNAGISLGSLPSTSGGLLSLPASPVTGTGVNAGQILIPSLEQGYLPPESDFTRNTRQTANREYKIYVTPLPKENPKQLGSNHHSFAQPLFKPSLQLHENKNTLEEFIPQSSSKPFGRIFFPSSRRSDGSPIAYVDNTRRAFVATSTSPFNSYNKYSLSLRS